MTGPKFCPPIGIGVYPQALAGLPEIRTLSMGYFSNADISDILNPPNLSPAWWVQMVLSPRNCSQLVPDAGGAH